MDNNNATETVGPSDRARELREARVRQKATESAKTGTQSASRSTTGGKARSTAKGGPKLKERRRYDEPDPQAVASLHGKARQLWSMAQFYLSPRYRPTSDEFDAVALPLERMALRRLSLPTSDNPDTQDMAAAGVALGLYGFRVLLFPGPVAVPPVPTQPQAPTQPQPQSEPQPQPQPRPTPEPSAPGRDAAPGESMGSMAGVTNVSPEEYMTRLYASTYREEDEGEEAAL